MNRVPQPLDVRADEEDVIEVEVQEQMNGKTVYVNVNGCTVARITSIKHYVYTSPSEESR